LVREAAAELYSGDPAGFIQRRGDLAAQARASGDAAAAKAISGLRKPTRSAWAVNRLMREDPDVPTRLSALGAGLRAAERALDGRKLRQLSQDRRELIAALTRQALAAAGARDAPAAFQEEVAATLSAAVADPQVAAELREGSLVRPVQRSGFGFAVPAGDESPDPAGNGDAPPSAVRPKRSAAGRRPGPGAGKQERAERQRAERERAERAERERAEQERAEQKRQRQAVAAAEKAVRAADQGVSAARAAEEERADAVLRMERQLADAQDRLAEAKQRSRAAVAGLRDARRALDRLRRRAGSA
jgi:flagellar biosynthesis GTPase FlhF